MARKKKYNKGEIWHVHKKTSHIDTKLYLLIIYANRECGKYMIHGMQCDKAHNKACTRRGFKADLRACYDIWVDESMMIEKVGTLEENTYQKVVSDIDMSVFYGKEN